MTSKQLQGLSKQELIDMARQRGIAGWHGMRKEQLIEALAASRVKAPATNGHVQASHNGNTKVKSKVRPRPLLAAARNTHNGISGEETVERSKYDVGVPT